MGGKPDYEARWEPDYSIVDQPDPGDQEAKVHSHIKCSALGTHLIKLGAAKVMSLSTSQQVEEVIYDVAVY